MRKVAFLAPLALIVVMAAPVASASAANTVTGACTLAGGATFSPNPLTATPQTDGYSFSGSGTCSGTLNGTPIANAPASAVASGTGTLSCSATESTTGSGTLTVNGVPVGFQLSLVGTGTEVTFALVGNTSGAGTGHATFAQGAATALQQCAGAGVSSLPFSVQAAAANLSG